MEKEEREKLGRKMLKNCDVRDLIDYYGSQTIMNELNVYDMVDFLGPSQLGLIDDDDLINAIGDEDKMLDSFTVDEIIEYLNARGYRLVEEDEKTTLDKIGDICLELQPHGFIDKERAKELLCDYIDNNMLKVFSTARF